VHSSVVLSVSASPSLSFIMPRMGVRAKTPPDAAAAAAPSPAPADRVFTQLFAALEGALVSGAKLNRLPPDLAHLDDLAHLKLAPAPAPAPEAHDGGGGGGGGDQATVADALTVTWSTGPSRSELLLSLNHSREKVKDSSRSHEGAEFERERARVDGGGVNDAGSEGGGGIAPLVPLRPDLHARWAGSRTLHFRPDVSTFCVGWFQISLGVGLS